MNEPGAIIGQAVVNVRTCQWTARSVPPCMDSTSPQMRRAMACPGCQGDGTWLDTSEATLHGWTPVTQPPDPMALWVLMLYENGTVMRQSFDPHSTLAHGVKAAHWLPCPDIPMVDNHAA